MTNCPYILDVSRALVFQQRILQYGFKPVGWVFGQREALSMALAFLESRNEPSVRGLEELLAEVQSGRSQFLGLPVRVVDEPTALRMEVE